MSAKTYFISGHRNITEEEFQKHYEDELFNAIMDEESRFVVGDYYGADVMAQRYLKAMQVKSENVTIYHMFDEPRNNVGFPTLGGFTSDVERDTAMTEASDIDIAWVREGCENSGTAQNIERRKALKRSGYIKNS